MLCTCLPSSPFYLLDYCPAHVATDVLTTHKDISLVCRDCLLSERLRIKNIRIAAECIPSSGSIDCGESFSMLRSADNEPSVSCLLKKS